MLQRTVRKFKDRMREFRGKDRRDL